MGDSKGQGRLACCSSQGRKEPDVTQQLNNKNKNSPRVEAAPHSFW